MRRWRSNVESVKQSSADGSDDSSEYQECNEAAKRGERTTGNNYEKSYYKLSEGEKELDIYRKTYS
jgi:hypothetical protein